MARHDGKQQRRRQESCQHEHKNQEQTCQLFHAVCPMFSVLSVLNFKNLGENRRG